MPASVLEFKLNESIGSGRHMNYLLQIDPALQEEKRIITRLGLPYSYASYADLQPSMDHTDTVPVGSVEFVRKYASLNKIELPESDTYPEALLHKMGRDISRRPFSEVPTNYFCKPIKTKVFNGSIKSNIKEIVSPDEEVWCSPPINFSAEFRVYVLKQSIVGYSRYDDGDCDASLDIELANEMVRAYSGAPCGYALDIGIADGRSYLVEVNDGWALGYYRWGNMPTGSYAALITERWKEIIELPLRKKSRDEEDSI